MLMSSRLVVLCRTQSCRFSSGKNTYGRFRKTHSSKELQTGSSRISMHQPGIGRRLKIIKEDQPDIEDMELEEGDIEDLEEDFLSASNIMEKHKREIAIRSFNIGLKITEKKYFKQPVEPNLLSWSEKEQIRNLHAEDRLVWTVEKLAESFPANEDIIAKILKSSWRPSNAAKIRKHDETVAKNWEKWYTGKLTIHNSNLREHLKKFNRRNFLPNSTADYSSYAEKSLPEPKTSEFSSIIENYNRLKLETENIAFGDSSQNMKKLNSDEMEKKAALEGSIYLDKKIHSRHHTLDTLRMGVAKSMAINGEHNEMDRQFIKKYVDGVNAKQEYEEVEEDSLKKNFEERGDKKMCKNFNEGLVENYEIICDGKVGVANKNLGMHGKFEQSYDKKLRNSERYEQSKYSKRNHDEIGDEKLLSDELNEKESSIDRHKSRKNYEFDVEDSSSQQNENNGINTRSRNKHMEREDGTLNENVGRINANNVDGENVANHTDNGEIIVDVGSPVFHKSADSEVVEQNGGKYEIGQVRSKSFESEFDANCKYPPARYNREGTIIWRPEKKHAAFDDDIPYRIRIPRDKIKKGYLYKVKDCFYTHEGEFLYRVPGMS